MAVPSRVAARLAAGIKRFQPILTAAKARDVNESDTVIIVTDMLQEVFGYDKFADITSEHAIRGTFCDLALKVDGNLSMLVEVKAVGMELKDPFIKQAVDYGTNQGVDWIVLTTGVLWRVYKVIFGKPIGFEIVFEFNFLDLKPRDNEEIELISMLTKESWHKERLSEYHTQRQALSRFVLGSLLLSEPILDVLRRELRRISPGIKIEKEEIRNVLEHEVIKRETLEGEKSEIARRLVNKAISQKLRSARVAATTDSNVADEPTVPSAEDGADKSETPAPAE